MTQGIYEIILNEKLTDNVYKMIIKGDTSAITAPGQFVNIKLEGKYLRRPISICDYSEKDITL
ncbi:MAG: dihydroorotate dehydrogenase electron transfer subunit, partial [Clostridia bacterium]|nr:dihydroorotate dehydrogenase electron transfer subunit [Clostridia bacterium]